MKFIPNGVNSKTDKKCFKKITRESPLMKLSYFLAARPFPLSASILMPTILGSALAYRQTGLSDFSWISFVLTLLTVDCVHGAGNVVNTYDYIKGVDNKKSDDRLLVDQLLSIDELNSLGALSYASGCLGFVILATIAGFYCLF